MQRERIRIEFKLMEEFLNNLDSGRSKSGIEAVNDAIESYEAKTVLVNDSVLGNKDVQAVLANAERNKVKIEVFNAGDEVGEQLHAFKDIASIG